jgi:exonuclease III
VRLVTWNCCRGRFESKVRALDSLDYDIALLQEIARPEGKNLPTRIWVGDDPRHGVAVIAGNGYTLRRHRSRLAPLDPVVPIVVSGPRRFNLLAVWGRQQSRYVRGVHARVVELRHVVRRRPTLIAGDFNSNTIWDKPRAPMDHSRFVTWMRDELGLVSAYHAHFGEAHGSESTPTYYHTWQEPKPYHIDYVFIPDAWRNRLANVNVGGYDDWSKLSDHRPLLVEVDLSGL